jgi:hypothetical protein
VNFYGRAYRFSRALSIFVFLGELGGSKTGFGIRDSGFGNREWGIGNRKWEVVEKIWLGSHFYFWMESQKISPSTYQLLKCEPAPISLLAAKAAKSAKKVNR